MALIFQSFNLLIRQSPNQLINQSREACGKGVMRKSLRQKVARNSALAGAEGQASQQTQGRDGLRLVPQRHRLAVGDKDSRSFESDK